MKHGSSTVVSDAVALQNVLSDNHFPCQPALAKRSIKGKHMRYMARLTAAKPFVFFYSFCNGFHFPLLTVGPLEKTRPLQTKAKTSDWERVRMRQIIRKDIFYSDSEYVTRALEYSSPDSSTLQNSGRFSVHHTKGLGIYAIKTFP